MKSKLFFLPLLVCLFVIGNKLNAQHINSIIIDQFQSPHMGATDLVTIQNFTSKIEDKWLPAKLWNEQTKIAKAGGIAFRLGKLSLLDMPQDYFLSLIQHEYFGHGFRYREFGFRNSSYILRPPFPFGDGHGQANPGELPDNKTLTLQQQTIIPSSGNEANIVLADQLARSIVFSDTLHYRKAMLYLITQTTPMGYLLLTKWSSNNQPFGGGGNDPSNYLVALNNTYGFDKNYNINQLAQQSLSSIINPLTFYALYTTIWEYGFKGNHNMNKIPMLRIGKFKILPLIQYNLTPFGPEYILKNMVKYRQHQWELHLHQSDGSQLNYQTIGLVGNNLINNKNWNIQLAASYWNQPELILKDNFSNSSFDNKSGWLVKTAINYHPQKLSIPIDIYLQLGYKTKGYYAGEVLDESAIFRCGLGLCL